MPGHTTSPQGSSLVWSGLVWQVAQVCLAVWEHPPTRQPVSVPVPVPRSQSSLTLSSSPSPSSPVPNPNRPCVYVCLCVSASSHYRPSTCLVHRHRLLSTWSNLDPPSASCITLTTWVSRRMPVDERRPTNQLLVSGIDIHTLPAARCLMVPLLLPLLPFPSIASAHCTSLVKS